MVKKKIENPTYLLLLLVSRYINIFFYFFKFVTTFFLIQFKELGIVTQKLSTKKVMMQGNQNL